MERDRLLATLTVELEASPVAVLAAYVFGSVARNEPREDGDVDVAVLLAAPPPGRLDGLPCSLEGDREGALGRGRS